MPLTEEQALDLARRFLVGLRSTLPYPVIDAPVARRFVEDSPPPRVMLVSISINGDFWEFDFMYDAGRKLVDPSGVRIFVDSETGAAALFSPRPI